MEEIRSRPPPKVEMKSSAVFWCLWQFKENKKATKKSVNVSTMFLTWALTVLKFNQSGHFQTWENALCTQRRELSSTGLQRVQVKVYCCDLDAAPSLPFLPKTHGDHNPQSPRSPPPPPTLKSLTNCTTKLSFPHFAPNYINATKISRHYLQPRWFHLLASNTLRNNRVFISTRERNTH